MAPVRDVAIVSYAHYTSPREDDRNEVEMLLPVLEAALGPTGLDTQDIGFTVSGSSDYLAGVPFSFVAALDAVGPWPPIAESHVEMDGAWALFEAWMRLQLGDIDTALVYAFGKSSPGDLPRVLAMQLDPYVLAPLFPDAISIAGLQARAWLDSGHDEREMAEVVARTIANADVDDLLAVEPIFDPLRPHDCAPITDGCAAIVLAAGDRARELTDTPVWIRGIDHRIEPHHLGVRDLTTSRSTHLAAVGAGVGDAPIDVAEICAPFSHQELILREALGVNGATTINPSGGALASNPMMVAGLMRFGEAARRLSEGMGRRAVAHATSGPALQQNLVGVLEVADR